MLGRERDEHRVIEQALGAQPGAVPLAGAGELEQQGQIEFARAQPRSDLLGLALGQRQRYVGVPRPKPRDGKRHQSGAGGRERRHSQPPRSDAEHRGELRLGRLDPREDRLRVLDQAGPRGRRPDPAAVAHDQRRAGLGLQPRDRLRDRRLGVRQRLGRARERPPARHLAQDPQATDMQH